MDKKCNQTKVNTDGFTLIELIIVISIIGLLATLGFFGFQSALEKGRDTQRLNDMRNIEKALIEYNIANGHLETTPFYGEDGSCGGWDDSYRDKDGDGISFVDFLVTGNFLRSAVRDSTDDVFKNGCGNYAYYLYSAGAYNCPSERGRFYVFGVRDMESSDRPHKDSPGWDCPDRNWQDEFDWVMGGYE